MPDVDDLDRILVSEDPLVPSSGFSARVLAAVEEVASASPPLPFPWGRFTVAVIATCVCVACGLWLVRGLDLSPVVAALTDVGPELGYALATILVTLGLLLAPRLWVAVLLRDNVHAYRHDRR